MIKLEIQAHVQGQQIGRNKHTHNLAPINWLNRNHKVKTLNPEIYLSLQTCKVG